jgi:hypothetical protein
MEDHIQYDFLYDNQFAELKEAELMSERIGLLASIEPYIGKYYSNLYVRKRILRQTDSDIIEIDEQIQEEIAAGIIPDPTQIDPITGAPLPPQGENMEMDSQSLGATPEDLSTDQFAAVTDAQAQKDAKKAEI